MKIRWPRIEVVCCDVAGGTKGSQCAMVKVLVSLLLWVRLGLMRCARYCCGAVRNLLHHVPMVRVREVACAIQRGHVVNGEKAVDTIKGAGCSCAAIHGTRI